MYLIVNYDSFVKYPEEFFSYKKAIDAFKKLNNNTNTLEYWDFKTQSRKVIIDRRNKKTRKGII